MTNRQKIMLTISMVISVVFLFIAFRGLNPGAVAETIRSAQFGLLLLGACTYFAGIAFITRRWKFLVDDVTRIPFRALYPLVILGHMGNNIYPFRAGEVLRLVLLRRGWGVPIPRGAVIVLVERCFDGLVMLTFILIPAALIDLQSEVLRQVASVAAPIFVTALLVFLVLAQRPEVFRRLVRLITDRLPQAIGGKLAGIADEIINGLGALRRPRDLFGAVACSYLAWMTEAIVYWLVATAVGLSVSYPLMLMVVGAVNLGGLIPASPGGVGVYEFLASSVLIAAGIAQEQAAAYAILAHLVIWTPATVVGLTLLPRMGLSFASISQAREMADEKT